MLIISILGGTAVCQFTYAPPHYTALQVEKSMESMRSTSSGHYVNMDTWIMTVNDNTIDESRASWGQTGHYTLLSMMHNIYRMLQAKDNVRNTSVTTAVTKPSMKPRCGAATYAVVEKGMEYKCKFGRTMIQALDLLYLAKRHISGRSDKDQWKNQACSLSHFWVMFVWRHQSDTESVSQSVSQQGIHRIFRKGFPLRYGWISTHFNEPEIVLIIGKGACLGA